MEHFGITQYGTKYPVDVFDPSALPAEDFYDELAAASRKHAEQRDAKRTAVEFTQGGVQLPAGGGQGFAVEALAASLTHGSAKAVQAGDRPQPSSKSWGE